MSIGGMMSGHDGAQPSCPRSIAPRHGEGYLPGVTLRRLLPFLTLLALMLAPLGRPGVAGAAAPAHDMAAMPSHCSDMPAPADREPAEMAIDCMMACAAVAPPAAAALAMAISGIAAPEAVPPSAYVGITPGSDPPPPRLS